jgi:competence protein ComEC
MSASTRGGGGPAERPRRHERHGVRNALVLGPIVPMTFTALLAGQAARPVAGAAGTVVVVVAAAAAVLLVAVAHTARVGATFLAGLLLVPATFAVVLAGVVVRVATHDRGILPELAARGGTSVLEARVATEPRRTDRGFRTVLRVTSVDGVPTRERAAAVLDTSPVLGTALRVRASARPLPEDGFGRWLAQQHAAVVLDVRRADVTGSPGILGTSSEWVRARIRSAATRHAAEDAGGLLVGFVTGDTRLLPEEDVAAMQATGLSHLTAVSGSNVAVLLGGIAALLAAARLGARARWTVLAATVPWFAFLTRLEPSVLRAGVMALLVIGASVRGVARDARHLLAGAVLLLLALDPLLSWSLGLLLSAGATLGVLVLAPALAVRLEGRLPRSVAQLLGVTLGAQVAVAPILIAGFGTIELITVPANMLAVPLAAVGSALAFVGSAVALVSVDAASTAFLVASPAAHGVLWVARVGETLPVAVALPEGTGWTIVGVAVSVALMVLVARLGRDPGGPAR